MDFTVPTMFPFCSHKVPIDVPNFFLNLFPIAHNSTLVNYKARQKEIYGMHYLGSNALIWHVRMHAFMSCQ